MKPSTFSVDIVMTGFFNHCSSVCPYDRGVLLAWYSGVGECQDDQSVHVIFIQESVKSEPLRIGNGTGNPVFIPGETKDSAILLWSQFEDDGLNRRLVDRWKTCSLWMQEIKFLDNVERPIRIGEAQKIAEPEQHLLGRCNPIQDGDSNLLPLYDEVTRECVIFKGSGLNYKEVSRYGTDMIQPTLWKKNGFSSFSSFSSPLICSLSRNFPGPQSDSRTRSKNSFFCEGMAGESWSQPTKTSIPNINNSLHVVLWNKENIILWNDTIEPYRRRMTLGVLTIEPDECGFSNIVVERIAVVGDVTDDGYGAYPSACVDYYGNLHFSFTNRSKRIEHHTWNYKHFDDVRRNARLATMLDKI